MYFLLQNFGTDGSALDDFAVRWAFNQDDPNDTSLWNEWQGAVTGNANAVQSFVLTALTALRAFTNRQMVELTATSTFALDQLRQQKTAVFFVVPAQHAEYYGFWTSVFFRSVFNACMRQLPQADELPVYILYDEFGHSTIPAFVSVANTIRGYRVSLSIVLQSLSQLDARYGRDYARSIQGGFNTYLAYSGSDPATAEFFEGVAGRVVREQDADQNHKDRRRHEFNLLNSDAVRRLEDGQALVVSANRNPAIIETLPYFENVRFHRVARRYPIARRESIAPPRQAQQVDLNGCSEAKDLTSGNER